MLNYVKANKMVKLLEHWRRLFHRVLRAAGAVYYTATQLGRLFNVKHICDITLVLIGLTIDRDMYCGLGRLHTNTSTANYSLVSQSVI